MTRITIELDDALYQALEESAHAQHRTPAEVIRELITESQHSHAGATVRSALDIPPLSLGKMLRPVGTHEEIFDEMLSERDE